jgi:hypothetical protein
MLAARIVRVGSVPGGGPCRGPALMNGHVDRSHTVRGAGGRRRRDPVRIVNGAVRVLRAPR